jgi:proteasome accessory factor B
VPTAPTTVEERLFSLVLALMATESGLTKNEILSSVQGYSARYATGGATGALERQFERDKDDLRELGIPLETIDSPDKPGDNTALRYLIPKRRYDLPGDVRFTPQEQGLLTLAGAVWREGSLSGESRRALLKLRAQGVEASEPLVGYAPRVRALDPAFDPLKRALGESVVSFAYLKPGEASPRLRTVFPLAVVQHDGRWHLFAHDMDAADTRTFLLSRIVGAVASLDTAVPDLGIDIAEAAERSRAELAELAASNQAVITVVPATDAALRLSHRASGAEGENLRIGYIDGGILADELASFGPEVHVVSPPELAQAVADRLRRVAALHTDSTQPDAASIEGADRG